MMDLRFALRLLRRSPAFAAAGWLTLAVGIASTTIVYAVVYSVLVRPLPMAAPDRLAIAYAVSEGVRDDEPVSTPRFAEWRGSGAFDALAAFAPYSRRIDLTDGPAERLNVAGVSLDFFGVLGTRAALGRVLGPADAGSAAVPAVISDALWRRRYHADPGIIGRTIGAGRQAMTVVGVMPPGFHRWRRETHIWAPLDRVQEARILASRGYLIIYPVGRLRPGVAIEDTQARLDAADRGAEERLHAATTGRQRGVRLVSLHDDIVPASQRQLLVVLLLAVGLTWFVVCANLSTLLLARGAGRAAELAIRTSLGADRMRLVRQLLVESAMLAIPGGLLGAVLIVWGLRALVAIAPPSVLPDGVVWIDWPVVAFAAALTVASTFVFGLAPALRTSTVSLRAAVQGQRASRTPGLSRALLAAEVAVGVVVLAGATLLVRSVSEIRRVDLGFDPDPVLTMRVHLPAERYGTANGIEDARYVPAQRDLLTRLGALPGIEAVTFGGAIFVPGADSRSSIALEDGRRFLNGEPDDRPYAPALNFVGPAYFRVHGTPLLRGRELTLRDDFNAPRVIVVNASMAEMLWPGGDAIGKRINFGSFRGRRGWSEPWAEIVGIVADVRHGGVALPPRPAVFRSALQYPRQEFDVMLRAAVAPATLAPLVRREIQAYDASILIFGERTLTDVVAEASAPVQYSSTALSLFAGLTAGLCGFGVFSLLSYAVTARRRELGIRIALGAAPARIAGDVARQALWMLVPGLAAGLVIASVSLRFLGSLLFGVSPLDPAALAGAAAALTVVVVAATVMPARSAVRVDPVVALRE
jgi:predicted permease